MREKDYIFIGFTIVMAVIAFIGRQDELYLQAAGRFVFDSIDGPLIDRLANV